MTALAKHHNVSLQAGELAKKRDYGSAKVLNMWKNMEQYRANHEPFEHGLKQGETPEMWWRLVASRLPGYCCPLSLMQLLQSKLFRTWEGPIQISATGSRKAQSA